MIIMQQTPDPDDVTLRPTTHLVPPSATSNRYKVRVRLEQLKDTLLDQLDDPQLSRTDRKHIEARLAQVRKGIKRLGFGATEADVSHIRKKYGFTQL